MYKIVVIPLAVGLIAQVLKFSIKLIRGKKFTLSLILSYGGMPSTHTAFALAVLIIVGLYEGIFSAVFAVAMVFTILIIRDALGIRRYLDKHSQSINKLIAALPNGQRNGLASYCEEIGHTPLEVGLGIITGAVLTLLFYWLLP